MLIGVVVVEKIKYTLQLCTLMARIYAVALFERHTVSQLRKEILRRLNKVIYVLENKPLNNKNLLSFAKVKFKDSILIVIVFSECYILPISLKLNFTKKAKILQKWDAEANDIFTFIKLIFKLELQRQKSS